MTVKNVNKDDFWKAPLTAISIGGVDMGCTVILDWATYADKTALQNTRDHLGGKFLVPYTGSTTAALTIDDTRVAIDSRLIFVPCNVNEPEGICVSGMSAGGLNQRLVTSSASGARGSHSNHQDLIGWRHISQAR